MSNEITIDLLAKMQVNFEVGIHCWLSPNLVVGARAPRSKGLNLPRDLAFSGCLVGYLQASPAAGRAAELRLEPSEKEG